MLTTRKLRRSRPLKITILGSGTSTGVPIPGCTCQVCLSDNPRNKRLRTSIIVNLYPEDGAEPPEGRDCRTILVDTSTDLREQSLRAGIDAVDSVLYTHTHADHIFGLDDLRSFNYVMKAAIPLYASRKSIDELTRIFSYAFNPDPNYLGGALPKLSLQEFIDYIPLNTFGFPVTPIPVLHGRETVHAFRFGNFAYVTDCSEIPDESREQLRGLECLVLDGLRERAHRTHFSFSEAIKEIELLKPKKAYLIHMTHEVDHDDANASIRDRTGYDVSLAYDGLEITCS